jgi:hypothetical protein
MRGRVLFKTFIIGILSGVFLATAFLHFVPVVDQHREASLISVQPNGGNTEAFHVNLPDDRILWGAAGIDPVPANLEWPDAPVLGDAQAELFKVRNRDDVVVGVASRISGTGTASGTVVEWTLHLPARGTLYVNLQPQAGDGGFRSGRLRAGTREFASMTGRVNERFIREIGEQDREDGMEGRIELVTALVGSSGSIE